MNLKKIGKVFTSKFVGTGPSSYKKKNLLGCSLTKVEKHCFRASAKFWAGISWDNTMKRATSNYFSALPVVPLIIWPTQKQRVA